MKHKLLTFAGALALMAVLGKYYATPLLAQARAALVKNIDERGRAPFMLPVDCGGFGPTNQCMASFPAVPANKRFVVEYINGNIDSFRAQGFKYAYLNSPALRPDQSPSALPAISLTTHYESSDGFIDNYSVSMPVLLFYEPGQIPVVRIFSLLSGGDAGGGAISGRFTLSGYLIDLNQ